MLQEEKKVTAAGRQLESAKLSRAPRRGRSTTRLRLDPEAWTERQSTHVDNAYSAAMITKLNAADSDLAVSADDIASLAERLRSLAHQADRLQADLLEALARFDELEGWRLSGAKDCVRWLCRELGLCRSLAYQKLSVARALRDLPIIRRLFSDGDLSWSAVRALVRVATPEDERALSIMALGRSADEVQRLCDEYRWGKSGNSAEDDAEQDRLRFERRTVSFSRCADGSLMMRAVLPPEIAANLVRCLEHQEDKLFEAMPSGAKITTTAAQRRADALIAMAEASLCGAGKSVSTADRYQVIAQIDVEALYAAEKSVATEATDTRDGANPGNSDDTGDPDAPLPIPLRAAIHGILGGSISPATARRLACDGKLVTMILKNGEPLCVGRLARSHNAATKRAVLARDGCCTFPGCGSTRHLDTHHVDNWATGGLTSLDRSTALCRSCHTRVHDEGWKIYRRVAGEEGTELRRPPEAERLLAGADARTRAITRVMDSRRPVFEYIKVDARDAPNAPDSTAAPDAPDASDATDNCCSEARAAYDFTTPHSACARTSHTTCPARSIRTSSARNSCRCPPQLDKQKLRATALRQAVDRPICCQ